MRDHGVGNNIVRVARKTFQCYVTDIEVTKSQVVIETSKNKEYVLKNPYGKRIIIVSIA